MVASKSDFFAPSSHGDPEKLGHFAGIRAADVAAKHDVRLCIDDQLHQHALVTSGQRMLHGLN